MRRSFNYTNRKSIPHSQVSFSLVKDDAGRPSFNAAIGMTDLDLPGEARVYVEAYYKRSMARFAFGTVAQVQAPSERWLDEVDFADRISFRVRVVDESGLLGRLLARVDGVEASFVNETVGGRQPLLPVSYSPNLGNEIWRVAFTATGPVLEVNSDVPGIRDIVRSDRVFGALVRPQAMRSVLERLLIVEDMQLADAGMTTWQGRWLLFSQAFCSTPLDAEAGLDDKAEWIDEAVASFAKHVDAKGAFLSASNKED